MDGTLNKVMLIGRLGDQVKLHYFEEGNCLGRFPLATNEDYKNKAGEKVTTTDWHNIVVRNKLAEICEKYLTKGDKIYCEGKIKTRQWHDENNQPKYTTEIYVNDVTFLSAKKEEASNQKTQTNNLDLPKQIVVNTDDPEDDLPF